LLEDKRRKTMRRAGLTLLTVAFGVLIGFSWRTDGRFVGMRGQAPDSRPFPAKQAAGT